MSRSATNRRVIYAGNSSTTAFSIPFNFQSNSSYVGAKLYNTSTEAYTSQVITTHYTISGSTLTMLTAPPTGTNLIIYSLVPLSQGVSLTNGVTFLPEDLMLGLDKLNDQIQQVNDKADRAMKWGLNAAIGFDPKMPSSITADATLIGNAAGDGLEFGPTVAEIEGWKDDAEAAAAAAAASQSAAASSASSASTSASAASTSASAAASSAAAAASSAASINGIPSGGTTGQVLAKNSSTNYDASWATPVADHGALTGLSDDDHAQYALLAGRSGGQTLRGGTASGEDLTLTSTDHATKGDIIIGTILTVEEDDQQVGVGTASPTYRFQVMATADDYAHGLAISNSTVGSANALWRLYTDQAGPFSIANPNQAVAPLQMSHVGNVSLAGANPDTSHSVNIKNMTGETSDHTLVVTKLASQTGDLLRVYDSDGSTVLFKINSSGTIVDSSSVEVSGLIRQNSQSAAYTLVIEDAGKHIYHPSSDNNARTFTIPANSSVAFPVGTAITFVNRINTVTIAITTDTMYLAGAGTTGSRTLAAHGVATAIKTGTTEWYISGSGLT